MMVFCNALERLKLRSSVPSVGTRCVDQTLACPLVAQDADWGVRSACGGGVREKGAQS